MFWWFVSQNRQESPRIENVIVHDSKAAKDIKRFFASSFMVTDNRSYIVQCSTTTPPFYMTFALLLKCQVKKKLAIIFLFKSHHNSSKMNLNLSRKWNRKLELGTHCQILVEILSLLKLCERSELVNISQLFHLFSSTRLLAVK